MPSLHDAHPGEFLLCESLDEHCVVEPVTLQNIGVLALLRPPQKEQFEVMSLFADAEAIIEYFLKHYETLCQIAKERKKTHAVTPSDHCRKVHSVI